MKLVGPKSILLLVFCLIASSYLSAQSNSKFAVRFNLEEVDCVNEIVYIDLEVKVEEGFPEFNLAEQNYRFSFNDNVVVNPRIVQELELSGTTYSYEYSAFFDPHHLNGSVDTIVSYNVVLNGGTGYPIDDSRWYPVGRIAFDILDMDSCLELKWHTHDPFDFPPTYIGEKFGGHAGTLFEVAEGSYDNGGVDMNAKNGDIACFVEECTFFPVELVLFEGIDKDCTNELVWATETETNNDYFTVEKSNDGRTWFPLATINGGGTTTEPQNYRYVDEAIIKSISYYRLKQVDFDGQISTSGQLAIRSSCYNDEIEIGITEIFPNPVKNDDRVNIVVYTRTNNEAVFTVTDATGRMVEGFKQNLVDGRNVLSFEAGNLAPGLYFVKVTGDGWYSITRKFVKVITD